MSAPVARPAEPTTVEAVGRHGLGQRMAAEFVGTAALLAIVVGSGRQGVLLSDDVGVQLLVNSIATGAGLTVLIMVLIDLSGAQFNPVVTIAEAIQGGRSWTETGGYLVAQLAGAVGGVMVANLMFGQAAISISGKARFSPALWLAEVVATAGLVWVIFSLAEAGRKALIPAAVGLYITAAYWFTASTSFANPAVTIARVCTDSFAGIAPGSVLPFVAAQLVGMAAGLGLVRALRSRAG